VTASSSECVLNKRKRAHIQCDGLQAWAVRIAVSYEVKADNEAARDAKCYCANS